MGEDFVWGETASILKVRLKLQLHPSCHDKSQGHNFVCHWSGTKVEHMLREKGMHTVECQLQNP